MKNAFAAGAVSEPLRESYRDRGRFAARGRKGKEGKRGDIKHPVIKPWPAVG